MSPHIIRKSPKYSADLLSQTVPSTFHLMTQLHFSRKRKLQFENHSEHIIEDQH